MLEDVTGVPPAISLLVSEVLGSCEDWDTAKRRVRDLLPELKLRSSIYSLKLSEQRSVGARPGELAVYLDAGLDLFSGASCADVNCRIEAATRLCRSVGLIADTIWLTDFISDKFCNLGRLTDAKLESILADTLVLSRMLPLIQAGIIKFRSPRVATCSSCHESFLAQVDEIADELMAHYRGEFSYIDAPRGRLAVSTGNLFDPPLIFRPPNAGRGRDEAALHAEATDVIRMAVGSALWNGRDAVRGRGAVFSNSKIGLAGLAHREGSIRNRAELQLLDDSQTLNVPWVSELSPQQIVELRNEADLALPSFRQMLSKTLAFGPDKEIGGGGSPVVDDLRDQCIEVRNELANINKSSSRYWKDGYVLLGFALSAYGVAAHQPAAALGGLLSLIKLIIDHKSGTERDQDKAMRRPGYVLVKAQDILSHAQH